MKSLNFIEEYNKKYPNKKIFLETNSGWNKIIDKMFIEIKKAIRKDFDNIIFNQIKEKFGTLRVYYSLEYDKDIEINYYKEIDKKIYKIINKYENKSGCTCEICGYEDKISLIKSINGYYSSICNNCYIDKINKINNKI